MKTKIPTVPTPDDAALWHQGALYLADQRLLPEHAEFLRLTSAGAVADAIRSMVVRGAPAIGVAAAYGVVLAGRDAYATAGAAWKESIERELDRLAGSRPTAVNLS
jgi:methylthioribose-1-phosphate isomerase